MKKITFKIAKKRFEKQDRKDIVICKENYDYISTCFTLFYICFPASFTSITTGLLQKNHTNRTKKTNIILVFCVR